MVANVRGADAPGFRVGARWSWSSDEARTWSTSYLCRAWSGERGRPDQMTDDGSSGGMKRVRVEVGMS